jgi:hypothetical protein
MMKLLTGMTTAALTLVLAAGQLSSETAEGRPQLDDDALTISGTVMEPGTRAPQSGVPVRLSLRRSPDGSRSVAGETISDGSGRFRFAGLTPGLYLLSTVLPSDSAATDFIAAQPKEVDLRNGGPSPQLEMWITRLASVSGRILGADGEPVPDAAIDLGERAWTEGEWVLESARWTSGDRVRTDKDGRYQVRVGPGDYYVWVRPWFCCDGFQSQYYPGVLYAEDATLVSVRSGVDLTGINVTLREFDGAYSVRFRLTLPDYLAGVPTSQPLSAYVSDDLIPVDAWFVPRGRGLIAPGSPVPATLEKLGDDVYRTQPMPPGEYDLRLQYSSEFRDTIAPAGKDLGRPDLATGIAELRLRLVDQDVDLGTIAATPVQLSGRVRAQGMHATEVDLGTVTVILADDWGMLLTIEAGVDGSFSDSLHRGIYRVLPSGLDGPPPGWYVASMRSGGRDVLREGLEVDGGPVPPLEIVLADDGARIEGIVRKDDYSIVPDARIVLIPPPNQRGPLLRFPTSTGGANGVYVIDDVPPGEYRVLALDVAGRSATNPYWEAPDFLREYEPRGERITVDPGARMTINAEAIPVYE